MVGVFLAWLGRIWIAGAIIGLLSVYFGLPTPLTGHWQIYHQWAPMLTPPSPAGDFRWVVWWNDTLFLALPGLIAVVLGHNLRRRREYRASGLVYRS